MGNVTHRGRGPDPAHYTDPDPVFPPKPQPPFPRHAGNGSFFPRSAPDAPAAAARVEPDAYGPLPYAESGVHSIDHVAWLHGREQRPHEAEAYEREFLEREQDDASFAPRRLVRPDARYRGVPYIVESPYLEEDGWTDDGIDSKVVPRPLG